jgi:hypothetical protein
LGLIKKFLVSHQRPLGKKFVIFGFGRTIQQNSRLWTNCSTIKQGIILPCPAKKNSRLIGQNVGYFG